MTNYAVIGAGFGDEGKGLMTDYLARKFQSVSLNVRHNGGAQAGHTVVDPANQYHGQRRHVFSHFGSASFVGGITYLSSRFIVNPFALDRERREMESKLINPPNIQVHPKAQVTTVYDIILNQLREVERGDRKHGSCGLGINETITRELAGYPLIVEDLTHTMLYKQFKGIYNDYWYEQLLPFINANKPEFNELLLTLDLQTEFNNLSVSSRMFNKITDSPLEYNRLTGNVIFEGAQGLQLDEFLGDFPHVTRSITGLPSAILAASEIGVREISPVYVTRCYKTRHGAGKLKHEGEFITSRTLSDDTNMTGRWQGEFRYAPLDIVQLYEFIRSDITRSYPVAQLLRVKINEPVLAVTCLDQVGDDITYYCGGLDVYQGKENLIKDLSTFFTVKYLSYGPSADKIVEV